ncbi:ty3-gypsy retroelement transposase [Cucumis melo var. makuwa]|uniref:Ty3-gypsy retroelement transposase n=1 Tax=Cucumis melo var. makuwa TaxID=1194695 RepID=A0A5D3BUE7_CUCMM|nr:ty3-gypsy retroelement transposase [Cucumis melo var. makuwa]TYK03107.1 ty3-gypsy retroelement transposase [Cucumis melo var. makuwa]
MKVKGKIGEEEVMILIDCGVTHNFIVEKLVTKLGLTPQGTPNYGVILGSRTAVKGKGVCNEVEVWVGEWKVNDSFLPLELGGVDIILGMKITIRGDPSLTKTGASLKNLMKSWETDDQGFLVDCRAMEGGPMGETAQEDEKGVAAEAPLATLMEKFAAVFEWREKLPPERSVDHHIYMKSGTDPVNVRPYRYAHH